MPADARPDAVTWPGWPASGGGEGWVEISHRLDERVSRVPTFPAPRIERLLSMPRDPMNVTTVHVCCHVGTHVDAPSHFIPGAPSVDAIPLDRLHGPGVVWRVEVGAEEQIGVEHLEACRPELEPDDILLLDTGWARYFRTPAYDAHPALAVPAARWLVDRRVKLLGLDLPTPDLAVSRRPAEFDWPVHKVLLSSGVLVAEHLTGLSELAGRRVEAIFAPIRIEGADGAPALALARPARALTA